MVISMNSLTHTKSSIKSPNWIITGGCGFIGTSLIKYILENDLAKKIRILDNLTVGTKKDLGGVCEFYEANISSPILHTSHKVELVQGDIRDVDTCQKCAQNMDVIVHLAANTGVPKSVENPRLDMECNVIGTFNMLEAAKYQKVGRFIFASSGAPAGEVEPPIHEELPPHPVSPYGASKLTGEGYCSAYFRTFGVETVALRFGNVYGPLSGHKTSVVAKFIKQALDGEPCEIYGDGTQTRDFIYIDDLIDAVFKAATMENIGGETFQIATNKESTVNEMAELLKEILKEEAGVDMKIIYGQPRLGDVKRNFSDTTKAKKLLGWECKWALDMGLQETVKWFLQLI